MDDLAREIQDMNQSLDRFIEKERVRLATRVMQYDCLKHYFRQAGRLCKQKVLKINGHPNGCGEGSCPKGLSPSSLPAQNAVKARGARQEAVGALPDVPEEALALEDRYRKAGDGRGESFTTSRSLPAGGAHLPADGANLQQPSHAQTSRSAFDGRRSSGAAEPRGRPESIRESVCVC